jgi:cyclohexanone monooxygenase
VIDLEKIRKNIMSSSHSTGGRLDLIVVGAGFSGMYMLHQAKCSGLSVKCFEAGSDVGGTWYWNRYPGARVDIESLEYSYSFSEELQQEWNWTERYAGQPELLKYSQHVADRFNLREDISFDTRIVSAIFDEETLCWVVRTNRNETFTTQFCVFATGLLSAPIEPNFDGLTEFKGEQYLTSRWPHDEVDFSGKRVGIIGTGSSGIQAIPRIAQTAEHLTVFQRTPAYTVPLRNCSSQTKLHQEVKNNYAALRSAEANSFAGFTLVNSQVEPVPTQSALEVPPDERLREYETRWQSGGLCFYYTYTDILTSESANETLGEFIRSKTRERIRDPEVAEKLVPTDYHILTRRLSADTDYCETYNRENVTLVDLREKPIDGFYENGISVGGQMIDLDVIIFATGFDVMTGAMDRIDIRGRGNQSLKKRWETGHTSYLGMMTEGFPNLLWMNGPGSPFYNPLLQAEYQGQWISRLISTLKTNGKKCIEPLLESEAAWVKLNDDIGAMTLFPKSNNYYMGDNIPGKPRRILFYFGGFPSYREQCESAAVDYSGFRVFGGV